MPDTWQQHAACRGLDPELFFVERGNQVGADEARAVCAVCPVAADCLEENIREAYGMWAGTSPIERRRIRDARSRRRVAEARTNARERSTEAGAA